MQGWWVTEYLNAFGPAFLISWVVWVIGSIVLHELAHGWAAIRCGDHTPIELGHMTWNPIVHMGWTSLILFAIVGITWGQMPVNPSRFRGRHDDAFVAVAGPAMNALLVVVAAAGYVLWTGLAAGSWLGSALVQNPELLRNMRIFFTVGLMLNIVLALFNLVPVPPLDGHRILGSFIPPFRRVFQSQGGVVVGLILFVLVFRFAGNVLYGTAIRATGEILTLLDQVFRLAPSVPTP